MEETWPLRRSKGASRPYVEVLMALKPNIFLTNLVAIVKYFLSNNLIGKFLLKGKDSDRIKEEKFWMRHRILDRRLAPLFHPLSSF